MGQQSNGIGLRFGVIDGWNSSWSINSLDNIEYRDLVQVSTDVEKLVTNLFKLNHGFIGKVGISKNGKTNKVIINVFGYVPSKFKFIEDRINKNKPSMDKEYIISPKKQLRLKLYRLAEILSMKYKYLGLKFAVKCILAEEYEIQPTFNRRKKRQKKQSFTYINKNYKSIQFIGNDHKNIKLMLPLNNKRDNTGNDKPYIYSQFTNTRNFKRLSQKGSKINKVKLPKVLLRSRKKFGFLKRLNYYSTLMNLSYWVFKTKQPQFLAKFLAQEFGKTRFQRSLYNNVDKVCAFLFNENNDIQGIRIQVSGRMNKSKRTRTFLVQYGAISTQTVSHSLKYAFEEAYTVYGSMGVKIWISY